MCIGAKICTELGADPTKWSRYAPLLPPAWFDGELNAFAEAVRSAAAGDLDKARLQLTVVRSDDLRSWYGDHGEKAGYFRCPHFGGRRKRPSPPILDPIRDTRSQEELVYKLDGYRCRYCSLRVIPGVVLKLLSKVVGVESFCMTGPRSGRHGAAVAFRACADHVVHHASGGLTNPENLVTACWSCNFAKVDYTLEEIGIEDPRLRPPRTPDDWDGLMSLVPELQQRLKETVNRTTGSSRVASVKRTESGTPKGIGGVSVALLHSWLTEWEQNNEQPPAAWTPFRVSFFVRNLETIKSQTKDFEP